LGKIVVQNGKEKSNKMSPDTTIKRQITSHTHGNMDPEDRRKSADLENDRRRALNDLLYLKKLRADVESTAREEHISIEEASSKYGIDKKFYESICDVLDRGEDRYDDASPRRIQVRVSAKVNRYLDKEALKYATSISSIASKILTEYVYQMEGRSGN
jgi:hypothetical protein